MILVRTVVLVAAFTVAGVSSVIVDTFGPGDTFRPPPGETIGGGILRGDPPPNQGVTQAFEFTPTTPTYLSSVSTGAPICLRARQCDGTCQSECLDRAGQCWSARGGVGNDSPYERLGWGCLRTGRSFSEFGVKSASSSRDLLLACRRSTRPSEHRVRLALSARGQTC